MICFSDLGIHLSIGLVTERMMHITTLKNQSIEEKPTFWWYLNDDNCDDAVCDWCWWGDLSQSVSRCHAGAIFVHTAIQSPPAYNYGARLHMTMFELLVTTEFHGVNKNLTDQMMQKHVPRYQKWTLTCWGHLCAHCYTITGPPPAYNYGVRLHMRLMLRVRRMEMWICLLNFYHHRLQHHHYQHHHLDPGVAYNYGCALAPTKGQLWMRIMWEGEIWIQTKVAGTENLIRSFTKVP